MKVTLWKIVNAYGVLGSLNNDVSLTFKIHYWCMRNSKLLSDSMNFYYSECNKIYAKYTRPNEDPWIKCDDDPTQYKINIADDSKLPEFIKEFDELRNMECNIEPYKIDAEYLFSQPTFNVSGNDIFQIDFLIENPATK